MIAFLSSLAWWEWILLIPSVVVLGYLAFGVMMLSLVHIIFAAVRNPNVSAVVVCLLAIGSIVLVILRHI